MAAALKNEALANYLLSWNSRYGEAMAAVRILGDMQYPFPDIPNIKVGILKITDPSWPVMLDFVQSEIAIRKSPRNLPVSPDTVVPQAATNAKPDTKGPASIDLNSTPAAQMSMKILKSEFDRAKTIVAVKYTVAQAGDQPLAPPYRLILTTPLAFSQQVATPFVYEFLSFEELRLDLRDMVVGEMEAWALWLAVIAFAVSIVIDGIRRATYVWERRRLVREVAAEVTSALAQKEQPSSVV